MNLRPSGYEPDELPDCSTPHQMSTALLSELRPRIIGTLRHEVKWRVYLFIITPALTMSEDSIQARLMGGFINLKVDLASEESRQ